MHRLFRSRVAGHKIELTTDTAESSNSSSVYHKRKKKSPIMCLPDNLLFKILLHLSAPDVYFPASVVCSKWWHMRHSQKFINAHFENTSYGLIYQSGPESFRFVSMKEDRIDIDTLWGRFRCPPASSCDGLLLEFLSLDDGCYAICNLSILKGLALPTFPHRVRSKFLCGLGYAAASNVYKVVVTYGSLNEVQCAILTVGIDESWRDLCLDNLSPTDKGVIIMNSPLITEGFMHWKGLGTRVVTLDVESETMYASPPPIPKVLGGQSGKYFMSTGVYLSLLIARGKLMWEVWEMEPYIEVWRKLPDICLEDQKGGIERLGFKHDDSIEPCGWLKYPEVLALKIAGPSGYSIVFYNIVSNEFRSEKLPTFGKHDRPLVHKNSLVWLGEGCSGLYSRHAQAVLRHRPILRRSRSLPQL